VTYSGAWGTFGSNIEFNETTSQPITPGANVTFTFSGTYFAAYGMVGYKVGTKLGC
jgi:hypothetical protein